MYAGDAMCGEPWLDDGWKGATEFVEGLADVLQLTGDGDERQDLRDVGRVIRGIVAREASGFAQ